MTSLSNRLRSDVHGETIHPEGWYECVIHPRGTEPRSYEMVSGEDILAAADFLDHLLQQKEDSND